MPFGIRKAKLTGLALAFIILLLTFVLLFSSSRRLAQHSNWILHSTNVLQEIETLHAQTTLLENRFRGYVATRRPDVLREYSWLSKSIDGSYKRLDSMLSDNPVQQSKCDSAWALTRQRKLTQQVLLDTMKVASFMDKSMNYFYNYIRFDGSPTIITDVIFNEMAAEERHLRKERINEFNSFNTYVNVIYLVCFMLALFVGLYSLKAFLQESKATESALESSERLRNLLQTNYEKLEMINTELEEKNQQIQDLKAEEKFAATGRMARIIAHEVRNPLTNINLATEQIREVMQNDEDNLMMLDMVKRNSLRINQLISDLLNSTRILDLQFNPTPILEIIEEALQEAHDRIQLKHVTVEKTFDCNCKVGADREKLKIAFLNIIVNGVEAMEDGGKLSIEVNEANNMCQVIIADNGTGMSEETLGRLFEPFYTSKEKGNGLGLTNSQNIILNHKGTLKVASQLGKGSTFTISLITAT